MTELPFTALDLRDIGLKAMSAALEEEGHAVMTAMANGVGLIYVDSVGPRFVVEVHEAPRYIEPRVQR